MRWRAGCLVLSLLAGGGLRAEDPLARAAALLAKGDAAGAEKLYREIVAREPSLTDAWRGLAQAVAASGRTAEAVELLLRTGGLLLAAGEKQLARQTLEDAVALAPESARAHGALGYACLELQQMQAAAAHLRRALELGDTHAAVRVYLGAALWESGRLEEAERVLREAWAQAGDDPHVLKAFGGMLVWQGRFAEAIPVLERAARAEPNSPIVRFDLGRALEGAARAEEALAAYRAALDLDPQLEGAHYRLARLALRLGRREEAQAAMARFEELRRQEQARTHEAQLAGARLAYARRLLREGRLEEAAARFRALGDHPDALAGLAEVRRAAGDRAGAVEALERAVSLAPERNDLKLRLLRARLEAGSF